MRLPLFVPAILFLAACGGIESLPFSRGSDATSGNGAGGSPAVASSASASASGSGGASSSEASAVSSSSSSGGGFYWKSGVQQNVPRADMTGWTECYSGLYADTNVPIQQILGGCQGGKLALACRPKGAAVLQVLAMGDAADVTFATDPNDVAAKHDANGVGWYFSPWQWGFLPAQDQRKGGCDATGISPNAPGPDGDKRVCWNGNGGVLWVGYRCGYGSFENTPGFDYAYERVVLSAP